VGGSVSEAQYSYVDRILSNSFYLSNVTLLKAVVGAVAPTQTQKNDFQGIYSKPIRDYLG
jgi:hypothetical protein